MVKVRRLPCRSVVARFAGLREPALHVIRIRRVVEILQMARHAGRARQVVVVVGVAIRTLPRRNCMRPGQSEVHHRMIEFRRRPRYRGMALRAVRWKVCGHVIGIRRALKILQVAVNAGCTSEVVNVVGMTVDALSWRHRVSTRQRKSH